MSNFSRFVSAFALVVAAGAFPAASVRADHHDADAREAAYQEALAECQELSDEAERAQCAQQVEEDYKAAAEAEKKE